MLPYKYSTSNQYCWFILRKYRKNAICFYCFLFSLQCLSFCNSFFYIDYGIVNSIDGYDEISLTGDFKVTTNHYERIFRPQDIGFAPAKPEELVAGATEAEAREIFDAVLENRALPAQKNIVLANAAFGIQVLENGQKSIEECVAIARESIDSGAALRTFKKFVELNG